MTDIIEDRVTGKAGFLLFGHFDDDEASIEIPITNWSAKVKRSFQDTTASTSYDPETKLLYSTRVPVAAEVEGSIEGWFRLNVIPDTIIKDLFNGDDEPSLIELWINDDNRFCSGYFTFSEFSIESPIFGVVSFRTDIKSFGVVEFGAFAGVQAD